MRFVNEVLKPYLETFFVVNLDDISIFNKTKEQHISHLREMLEWLLKMKLLINLKNHFFITTT
jgi:hypothetical protein